MSTTVQLQEWRSEEDVELSFEQVDALRRVAGKAIDITPGRRRDTWNLRATSYAGAIRVGDLSVLIRPKVPLENLFYMLSAGQNDLDFGTSLIGFEEDELLPALAAFFERLVTDTLKRGVLKSYKEHNETLVALRGRIDVPAMLRTGGMPAPIPCRFDELSIDIAENRILRTAAIALTTYPDVAPAVRRNLRRSVGVLDGVALVDSRAIPPVNLTRLNRYYEPALRMAEVILRSGGVRDRAGTLEASTFLIDMNRLFERFVTIQLRRLLAGKLEVRDQETHPPRRRSQDPDVPRPGVLPPRRAGAGGGHQVQADRRRSRPQPATTTSCWRTARLWDCREGCLSTQRTRGVAGSDSDSRRRSRTLVVVSLDLSGSRPSLTEAAQNLARGLSDHVLGSNL